MSNVAIAGSQADAVTLKRQLESEISMIVRQSEWRARFDTTLHQVLVIIAAFAGFCSLVASFAWSDHAWIAGTIGAVPSLASILAGQLHCVKAANWQRRRAVEVDGIRKRLQYEMPANPTRPQIAQLSSELRLIEDNLTREWEAATKADDTAIAPKVKTKQKI